MFSKAVRSIELVTTELLMGMVMNVPPRANGLTLNRRGVSYPPTPLIGNGKGVALWVLGGACGLLGGSCGRPELPRRDADDVLEVAGELALVREPGARGHLRQGQTGPRLQEVLGPFNAAQNDVLVRRQPGGLLELPRNVVRAEASHRRHLFQRRAGVQVPLDVLDHGPEPPARERAIPP